MFRKKQKEPQIVESTRDIEAILASDTHELSLDQKIVDTKAWLARRGYVSMLTGGVSSGDILSATLFGVGTASYDPVGMIFKSKVADSPIRWALLDDTLHYTDGEVSITNG